MENTPRSQKDEVFDWFFISQNPTNNPFPPPSPAAMNGGASSSSMRPVNHNDAAFLLDHGVLPYQNKHHQQLPSQAMGVNPAGRSVLNNLADRYPLLPDFIDYNPYEYDLACNDACNPLYCGGRDIDFITGGFPGYGYNRSPMTVSGFPEPPYDSRNLEMDFSRLNLSSPNLHQLLPYFPSPSSLPASTIRNNSFMYTQLRGPPSTASPRNVNPVCNDICCNPIFRRDHRVVVENSRIRSRDNYNTISNNYQVRNPNNNNNVNTNNNNNPSSRQQENQQQQQEQQPPRFPASLPLKDLRGSIYLVAKDQEGCQYLQIKCEKGEAEDIDMIFTELKDHAHEVMADSSMNYLSQKLFKELNARQITEIMLCLMSDHENLTSVCVNPHGTRAVQKLIEHITTSEQRSMIVSALRRCTVILSNNTNGHHIIQNILKGFHVNECQPIIDVVADHSIEVAMDRSGCCVLQQCISLPIGIITRDRLITPIIESSLHLSEHPYGNYVVQHILGMHIPEATAEMLRRLTGNFVALGMNKFASNVVEKFLKEGSDDVAVVINREFVNSRHFISLITNQYGNYVAQSALHTAKGGILETMINKIQKEYASLHSHPHGKRVLALARSSRARVACRR